MLPFYTPWKHQKIFGLRDTFVKRLLSSVTLISGKNGNYFQIKANWSMEIDRNKIISNHELLHHVANLGWGEGNLPPSLSVFP